MVAPILDNGIRQKSVCRANFDTFPFLFGQNTTLHFPQKKTWCNERCNRSKAALLKGLGKGGLLQKEEKHGKVFLHSTKQKREFSFFTFILLPTFFFLSKYGKATSRPPPVHLSGGICSYFFNGRRIPRLSVFSGFSGYDVYLFGKRRKTLSAQPPQTPPPFPSKKVSPLHLAAKFLGWVGQGGAEMERGEKRAEGEKRGS